MPGGCKDVQPGGSRAWRPGVPQPRAPGGGDRVKGGAVSPIRGRHPRPSGPPSPLTHGRADPRPPRQRHLKNLVQARAVQHRARLAGWSARGWRWRLRAGLGARATAPEPWASGPRAERLPRAAPVCARSPEAAPTAPPAPQRPMRRRPECCGASLARQRGGGGPQEAAPESWQVAREARARLRGWVPAPGGDGRTWAALGPSMSTTLSPCLSLVLAAVGPPTPSLFVSSFFSLASSRKGSAWVLYSE